MPPSARATGRDPAEGPAASGGSAPAAGTTVETAADPGTEPATRPGALPEAGPDAGPDVAVPVPGPVRALARSLDLEPVRELGRGARTAVYQAVRDGRPLALKVTLAPAGKGDDTEILFRREAALLAGIDHPDVVRVHEVGRVDGRPYQILDLVPGRTLRRLLDCGPLDPLRAARLAEQVAGMLAAAHRRGVVHRDVKPANIMVTPDDRAILIDFGLLSLTQAQLDPHRRTVAGTFTYCSPEQSGMLHRPVDGRSDLYSLGVVLHECLAGSLPFAAEEVGELLRQHAAATPPSLLELRPDVPPALAGIVERLLAKDPDDRFPDAAAVATALSASVPGGVPGAQSAPHRAPRGGGVALPGREAELARLAERWARARGGAGGAVSLRGARGTGRSRTLAAVAERARADGGTVLFGRCPSDAALPLAALRQAVETHLRELDRLPEADREAGLERVRTAAGGGSALLGALSPRLTELVGARPRTGEDRQEQFVVAVADFLTALGRGGALLLALDDVQWVDELTARVLRQLGEQLDGAPALVVLAGSPPEAGSGAGQLPDGEVVELGPLPDAAIPAVAAELLPGVELPAALTARLRSAAAGNPLAVEQFLQVVLDAGLIAPDRGGWAFDEAGFDRLDLPGDALELALARWRQLDPAARELLVVAAVAGAEVDVDLVAAVGGQDPRTVRQALVAAVRSHLLQPAAGESFGFPHHHLREELAARLDPARAGALHHDIARHLAATPLPEDPDARRERQYRIARHHLSADPGRDPQQAFAACWQAGVTALEDHAPALALRYLEHAATLPGRAPAPAFLLVLGTALQREGRFTAARERFEEALELEPDPVRRARLYSLLAQVHRSLWETGASLRAVEAGLAELGTPLRHGVRLFARTVAMVLAAGLVEVLGWGRGTLTGERRERYLLRANLHETGGYAAALNHRPLTMAALDLSSLFLVARVGLAPEYARSYGGVGFVLRMAFLDRLASRAFARAARVAAREADPRLEAQVAWHDACARFLRGADDGQALAAVTLERGRWLDVGSYCDGVALIGIEATLRGDTAGAERWLEAGRHRVGSEELWQRTAMAQLTLAVPAALGRVVETGHRFEEARRLLTAPDTDLPLRLTVLAAAITALHHQEDHGRRFEEVYRWFHGLRVHPLILLRVLRPFHVHAAAGRLRQCRTAPPEQRAERLAQARTAVRALRRTAHTELLRGYHRVWDAEWRRLAGRPQAALDLLAGLAPPTPDAPALALEAARVRARAWFDLQHDAEAHRWLDLAVSIAADRGWGHLLRSLEAEFGIDAGTTRRSHVSVLLPGVGHSEHEQLRLTALEKVSLASTRVIDPVALTRIALDQVIGILGADRGFLFLTDGAPDRLVPGVGRTSGGGDLQTLTGYSRTLVERVARTGEPVVVTGTEDGEALGAQSVVLHDLRSILIAPVQIEERLLGVIYLDSKVAKGVFDSDDITTLTAVSTHIAASLETARAAQLDAAVKVAHSERDLAESLRGAMAEFVGTLDPAEVLQRLIATVQRLLPVLRAAVVGGDGEGRQGWPELATLLAAGSGPVAWQAGEWSAAAAVERRLSGQLGDAASWLLVPLQLRDTTLGALALGAADPEALTGSRLELAAALGVQAMVAYDNARLFARVEELATTDTLTGVPTRRAFAERAERLLAEAAAGGSPVVAVMADIDHFKSVNDSHGHQAGDEVLRTVAARLVSALGDGALIGRYGGEEFALLVPVTDGDATDRVERARVAVGAAPVRLGRGTRVRVSLSAGLTAVAPGEELDAVLARADGALYAAKAAGRDRSVTC